jgi:hypothetical protein
VNEVIVGPDGLVTVKSVALVAVLTGVVTPIFPVVAPEGTVAVICVFELTVNPGAGVALNVTADAPHRFVPVIVTEVPTGPLVGLKELMAAARLPVTVKVAALLTVTLSAPVTEILPLFAPAGTVAVIFSEEFTVYEALVPPNATAVAPVKFVPVIVTEVPTGPQVGTNEEIEALAPEVTTKSPVLVAVELSAATTEILPVVAPVGTVAVMLTLEFTVKPLAPTDVLLNFTFLAPVKPWPLMDTEVPTGPLWGENEVMLVAAEAGTAPATHDPSAMSTTTVGATTFLIRIRLVTPILRSPLWLAAIQPRSRSATCAFLRNLRFPVMKNQTGVGHLPHSDARPGGSVPLSPARRGASGPRGRSR